MKIEFGPSLWQKDPLLIPKDIDDCWVVAALQVARAVGAAIAGITIPVFRKAANRPDNPQVSNPGGAADVIRGLNKLWPKLRVSQSSRVWVTYRASLVKQGKVSILMVLSDKLTTEHQYGFKGPKSWHAISVRYVAGTFYGVNPLQPKGTKADRYSESELKAAAEAYPNGVQAVLVLPALAPVPPTLPADPTPFSQDDLDDAEEEGRINGIQEAIDALEKLI